MKVVVAESRRMPIGPVWDREEPGLRREEVAAAEAVPGSSPVVGEGRRATSGVAPEALAVGVGRARE